MAIGVHMGHERDTSLIIVGFALSLIATSSCGGASEETLRTRAAFDMKCTDAQLQVIEIDDRTRGVVGCGQRHTYVEACKVYGQTSGKSGCTWVLNGSSDR